MPLKRGEDGGYIPRQTFRDSKQVKEKERTGGLENHSLLVRMANLEREGEIKSEGGRRA